MGDGATCHYCRRYRCVCVQVPKKPCGVDGCDCREQAAILEIIASEKRLSRQELDEILVVGYRPITGTDDILLSLAVTKQINIDDDGKLSVVD